MTPPRPDVPFEPQPGRTWADLSPEIRALIVFGSLGAAFMGLLILIGWFA